MNHIVLIGDSIFDNASYVGKGESVHDVLLSVASGDKVSLLAVDGDVTTDVPKQLDWFPTSATHAFVSCGGNDALRAANILGEPVSTVGEAMVLLAEVRESFRLNYKMMLQAILGKTDRLTVCTIYNEVPGTSEQALSALALFNEVILQEAVALNLPIIDLRLICNEAADYSSVSPIEPSGQGSVKIANSICKMLKTHDSDSEFSVVYV